MKTNRNPEARPSRRRKGFTLIEMLVVIAIMSLLAGMVFPITKAVNRTKMRARARAELAQLQTAIESYKLKLGFYPPDNRNTNSPVSQLYYELVGTTLVSGASKSGTYQTLDGSSAISVEDMSRAFGVDGFANATRGGGDEGQMAINFFKGIRQSQYAEIRNLPGSGQTSGKIRLLVGAAWPENFNARIMPDKNVNPWRYNSSAPRYNPAGYDLYIDVIIDGKTNRIGNWSKDPVINPR